ncbi:MAG TPA: LPS export ABC transporter ATP-binding protein [Gemmatimonadaceae bacterium]|nr:LPS export ABC transporter ATP-binding protein [Gemmatimonadaceae bacterium]
MRTVYSPRVEDLIARMSKRERSVALALQTLFARVDERGTAGVHDVAVAFRDEHLRTLRLEGKNVEQEAGRLSLDEVDRYVADHALPRLSEDGVIRPLSRSFTDPDARVAVDEALWREVAPVREEVARLIYEACDQTEFELHHSGVIAIPRASVLEAEGLVKTYRRRKVVNDVRLRLQQGEIVGLLGPNGAGKTTTFYMIVGLIKPLAGRIILDGADITDMPMYRRARRGIGYLSQEPSIFRKLSVEDNILAILETLPLSADERRARLETLLDELGIKRLRKNKAYSLSGGERRRLEITRALVTDPKFMMLDEPFAGVDPIAVHDIQTIVAGLRHRGIGVLISDHNVEQTLDIVDRAYIMFDGQVKVSGTVRDLVFDDTVAEIYLGPTLTARLRARFAESEIDGVA